MKGTIKEDKKCNPCSIIQTRANNDNSTVFNKTHESPPLLAVIQQQLHLGYISFYCANPKGL